MRCLNCTAEAQYLVKNTSSADQVFCAIHIPGFLKRSKEFASRVQPLTPAESKPKKKKEKMPIDSLVKDLKIEQENYDKSNSK